MKVEYMARKIGEQDVALPGEDVAEREESRPGESERQRNVRKPVARANDLRKTPGRNHKTRKAAREYRPALNSFLIHRMISAKTSG